MANTYNFMQSLIDPGELDLGKMQYDPRQDTRLGWMAENNLINRYDPREAAMMHGSKRMPYNIFGQSIPYQRIQEMHPYLDPKMARKLSGPYVFDALALENNIPLSVLIGHEGKHEMQQLGNLSEDKSVKGRGNRGYLPSKNPSGSHFTHSGMEAWLLNYPPEQRGQERSAELKGMQDLMINRMASIPNPVSNIPQQPQRRSWWQTMLEALK